MSANTAPRYTLTGDVSSNNSTAMAPVFTTAAADYDGTTATHNKVVFTAGANGARIAGIRFKAKGSNVASVARVFVNNGTTPGTATNNSFIGEVSLPATTAIATAATVDMDYYFPGGYIDLQAAFTIIVGLGTTVSAGWVASPIIGGQF
jgi:hypothetical protein